MKLSSKTGLILAKVTGIWEFVTPHLKIYTMLL